MTKATLAGNLFDLEKAHHEISNAISMRLNQEAFKELIEDYKNILENVKIAYNDDYPGIVNGIQSLQ
jgi:hypothetical protein